MVAMSLHAEASTFIAAANITSPVEPLIIRPLLSDISFATATTTADNPATPTSPFNNSSQFKDEIFFKAEASTNTATDIVIIPAHAFVVLLSEPLILLNIAIEAIRLANNTLIAPNDCDNFSLSIRDITTMLVANIAIADAIFISVPALIFV